MAVHCPSGAYSRSIGGPAPRGEAGPEGVMLGGTRIRHPTEGASAWPRSDLP